MKTTLDSLLPRYDNAQHCRVSQTWIIETTEANLYSKIIRAIVLLDIFREYRCHRLPPLIKFWSMRNVMFHKIVIMMCCAIVLALQNHEYDQGNGRTLKGDPSEQLCILYVRW